MKALGFIEVTGLVPAINAVDNMVKTADVEFVTWEKKLGGRLVTIIVEGSVSAVTEAVAYAKEHCISKVVADAVIANPHEELKKLISTSLSKYDFPMD